MEQHPHWPLFSECVLPKIWMLNRDINLLHAGQCSTQVDERPRHDLHENAAPNNRNTRPSGPSRPSGLRTPDSGQWESSPVSFVRPFYGPGRDTFRGFKVLRDCYYYTYIMVMVKNKWNFIKMLLGIKSMASRLFGSKKKNEWDFLRRQF